MEFPEGPALRPRGKIYIFLWGFLDFMISLPYTVIVMLFIIGFPTASIFCIWGMVDAYRLAKGINQKMPEIVA